jgi:hypothetical protein
MVGEMNAESLSRGKRASAARSRRSLRWLRALVGALAVLLGTKATASIAARHDDHHLAAAEAPKSWQEFAGRLQLQFQQELSVESEAARRFYQAMTRLGPASDAAPPTLVVRAWVMADGKVWRLELEDYRDDAALDNLYVILTGGGIGAVPPDMPQPLRLRLSLHPRKNRDN